MNVTEIYDTAYDAEYESLILADGVYTVEDLEFAREQATSAAQNAVFVATDKNGNVH